jgi:hypothetical protein
LLFLLTLASIGSALLIRNAYDGERRRAKEAEDRLRLARRSVDDILQTAEQELGDNPMMQGLRKKLLEWALSYYQEFVQQRTDDPEFQADLAATRDRIQKILSDLAELEGSGRLFLLNLPDVQEDLRVTADQQKQLDILNDRLRARREELFQDIRRLSVEEKRSRFLDVTRENEAGVAGILDPIQQARLRQIDLQTKGPMAFRDPAVVAALKLTPEQQDRIKLIEADRMFMFRPDGPRPDGHRGPGPGGPPFGPKKGPDQMRRPDMVPILAVLTDDQQARWQELTGRPFNGRRPFGGGPGGPGGRFGPPPGGGPGPGPDR